MIEALQDAVNKMDVPPYKKDVAKGHNVEWLLANLGKRNAQHPQYIAAMHMLLNYAEAQKMLKRTVIERYREHLKSSDVYATVAAEPAKSVTVRMPDPRGGVSSVLHNVTDGVHPPRGLLKVPKSGAPLYPHQKSALRHLLNSGRTGELTVIAHGTGRSVMSQELERMQSGERTQRPRVSPTIKIAGGKA